MSRYFEDEEPEPEESRRDHEVTFGGAALMGIVICLVLICAMCFGIGYTLGKHSAGPATASATAPAQTPAPDQEPLQGSGSIPKPSASEQVSAPPADTGDGATPAATDEGANPPAAQPSTAQPAPQATVPAPAPSPVRAAMPAAERPQPAQAAPIVRPAMPAQMAFMVQIAAVANPEDAEVLVNALRKRNYVVTARRDPDGLIHVRIGPFSTHDEASRWRDKLLGDGYNAMIQP